MPNVRVNPIQSVNVRVNQRNQVTVASSSTFVAATDAQAQIDFALQQANTAVATAGQALSIANSAYSLANTANTSITELGTLIDGGIFS